MAAPEEFQKNSVQQFYNKYRRLNDLSLLKTCGISIIDLVGSLLKPWWETFLEKINLYKKLT